MNSKPARSKRNTGNVSEGHGITEGWQAVDIGHATIALYEAEIAKAKTILWNGPLGVFEIPDLPMARSRSPKRWRSPARRASSAAAIPSPR